MTKEEKSKYNILIVEDMSITRKDITKKVEGLGYNVCGVATSYEEAIEVAQDSFPHIALCDIKLDGYQDGTQVAKKLKEMGDVSIIFLTAYSKQEYILNAMQSNPTGYLLKKYLNTDILDIHIQLAIRNLKTSKLDEQRVKNGKYIADSSGIYQVIHLNKILYIKANNNKVLIVAEDQVFDLNQKFGTTVEHLVDCNIVQISRSHAINLDKIHSIDKGLKFVEIKLDNVSHKSNVERTITISKSHRNSFKKQLGI